MQWSLEGESSLVLISAASPIQTCVEIELKRIRLGGVASGLGECCFVLQKNQTVLVAGCSRRLYPKTNGTVQLSG